MSNILQTATAWLKTGIAGDPPPPALLDTIGNRLDDLLAVSVDPSGDGIERWLSALRAITQDDRLHETLIVRAVQVHFPRLAEALTLLEVIDIEWGPDDRPAAFAINWQQIDSLLADPGNGALTLLLSKVQKLDDVKALQVLGLMLLTAPQPLLALEYAKQGFGSLPLAGDPGVTLQQLLDLINSPLSVPLPLPLPLDLAQFTQLADPAASGTLGALTLDGPVAFDRLDDLALETHLKRPVDLVSKTVDLGGGWQLSFGTSDAQPTTYRLQFSADRLDAAVSPGGELSVLVSKRPGDAQALLVGEPDGTHFAIQTIGLGIGFRPNPARLFDLILRLSHIELTLKPDFLRFLSFGLNLPTLLRFSGDVDIVYVQGQGIEGHATANGIPTLSAQFATPLNLKIGGAGAGVQVDQVATQIDLAWQQGSLRFRVALRYGAQAQFGPLTAIMDGAGAWFGRWTDGTVGLLPPQGVGLALQAGPVAGGGFLKAISAVEFAGVLQLKILGIGAFAYGLYQTLPGGDPAFVALIGIRLPPPGIQIGFGFAVSGFGGLVGINRRADTDLLRERLASGASGDVLFNDNPMRNAPKLLGDMAAFFPAEKGVFLIGPTLQLNWLYILTLDVGVFIELPGPRQIFIAGSARLVIGSEDVALVYLRMDFIGGIDFTKSLIFFDAALVNSHVLGIFRITGGVALRIAYGSNGYFLFTVGGFHPSFNPGSLELPRVARVGVALSLGPVWLKQEMYLALTSNTFQLGARIEAGIQIGPIAAHGWFGFDALIQFKPFFFVAHIEAGFDVEVSGVSLCSVRVSGQLSGPGPLILQAAASVRILFVKVSADVTITLSSNPPENVSAIPNLPEHLKGELAKPDNLRIDGDDRSVILAPQPVGGKLFAPVGELVWEQKRVPLNLPIQKAEGVKLTGWHTLTITSGLPSQREDDWFGVGTYLELPDGEALNSARFAPQQSGVRIGAGDMSRGAEDDAEIKLTLIKLPKRVRFSDLIASQYVNVALSGVLGQRGGGAVPEPGSVKVAVQPERWQAHGADGQRLGTEPVNSIQALVQAKRSGGIAVPASQKTFSLTGVL